MEQKDVYLNDFQSFFGKFMDKIISFLPSIIGAIIVLFVGVWICRFIRKFVRRLMIARSVDITIQNFVNELLRWVLYIILFLTVIQKIGVPVSSFLGALAAAGVAIGLALQGSLSNFAGGIMLLILKPFRIGDSILPLSSLETNVSLSLMDRYSLIISLIILKIQPAEIILLLALAMVQISKKQRKFSILLSKTALLRFKILLPWFM